MPAPTTADELLDLLQKSALVEEPRLKTYVQKLRDTGAMPSDPSKLAQFLVRDALLTYFQAEQILQGKYKRFSLGKYKVLEKLGSGGMGTVFLCEHKLMRRRVAVKVLPVPKSEDKASLDRFYREARAIAAVDHPNIVRAYDIDQDDNLHFLVMEWVDGTNLQDLVKKFGPLDPLRACHYIYGSAVGLQHAHEIGLIHRDIKPGNILIDRSGVVKILDLGLARLTNDLDDNLTRQNDENVLGTADYLAPEQAMDSHTVDIRADIYSLGATFYFLLTGSPVFPEGSVAQKLIWQQNREPRPIKTFRTDVPDELIAVVEKMMAKEATRRYQTPAEVMSALSRWVTTPIPPPSEREMPTLSPAVAGGQGGTRPQPAGPSLAGPTSLSGGMPKPFAVGGGPPSFSDVPTTITAGMTPAPTHAPAAAVWSTLDAETQNATAGDTDGPRPSNDVPPPGDERPSRVGRRERAQADAKSKRKLMLFAAAGVVLLAAGAAGAYFAFFNKRPAPNPIPNLTPVNTHRIVVTKAGGENTANSLREALQKAGVGDTIIIAEPKLAEPALTLDRHRHKDVTIESGTPDGKPAVIEFLAPPGGKGGVMFDIPSVEGLRLRNIEFDGKGQVERGVQFSGPVYGTTLEGVTVRDVTKVGIYLQNVTGEAGRPLTLDRVRVLLASNNDAGVMSYAFGGIDNKFFVIKNSRFEGPGKAGLRFDGPFQEVTVSDNRFFDLGAAVSLVSPNNRTSKGLFITNTVYKAQVGFQFDAPPKDGRYEVKVTQNYFAQTRDALKAQGDVPGLVAENNVCGPNSGFGNPPLSATKLDKPALPNPNKDDDATFLRFPAGGNPTVGPNKVRIGAQLP